MQIKAVLFDIDGTLIDSNDMHVSAWQEAFAGIGAVFDARVVHAQLGKGADMLIPALLPGLDEETRKQLGESHGRIFKTSICTRQGRLIKHTICSRMRMALGSRWRSHRRLLSWSSSTTWGCCVRATS